MDTNILIDALQDFFMSDEERQKAIEIKKSNTETIAKLTEHSKRIYGLLPDQLESYK